MLSSNRKTMLKNYLKIITRSLSLSLFGVFVIDYFSHLLFSSPMETPDYFMAKAVFYFVFSIIFLSVLKLEENEFIKVAIGGVVVASLWGAYYNVLPAIFDYYPFGISLRGLTFLGLGLFGAGLAFGIVHTIAFFGGYYFSKLIFKITPRM
ncbi:MAG: hypothetical protein UW11_C0010G0009 [Parcubacteria group bacterium GW2011_GWA2_43_9b]|nr:MAG: hypothetical protein UW11_C0010G0009 [Parcubacteria group bacterium GW2011_GWA2_43_9b]